MTIKNGDLPVAKRVKSENITMGSIVFNPGEELAKEAKNDKGNNIKNLQKAIKDAAFKPYASVE